MLTKRAEQWAIKKLQEHRNYSSMSDRMRKVWMDAYTQDYVSIANEQENIDEEIAKMIIERASMQFYKELKQMVSMMNAVAPGSGDIIDIEKSVKHFIDKLVP